MKKKFFESIFKGEPKEISEEKKIEEVKKEIEGVSEVKVEEKTKKKFFERIFKRKPKRIFEEKYKKKLREVGISITEIVELVLVYLVGVIVGLILAIFSNYIFLKDAGKKDILISQLTSSTNYQTILVVSLVFGIIGFGIGYLIKRK
jgi:uncharacterized membrane protein